MVAQTLVEPLSDSDWNTTTTEKGIRCNWNTLQGRMDSHLKDT
jgi:hypothetical protein